MKRDVVISILMGFGLILLTERVGGVSYTVQMTGGLTFSPATLSVGQGDTVTWTNVSAFGHTSTSGNPPSGDGLWASPTVAAATAFSVTFTNFAPNAYPYFCAFHYSFGMVGTLTVTNAGVTPTPPSLENPSWKNGQFQFTVSGKAGTSYVTETSSNFVNWQAISTNIAPADTFTITKPAATSRLGFYRVRQGS